MTTQDYNKQKNEFLEKQLPFRAVNKDEIVAVGENFFKVEGVEMEIDPSVSESIDKLIGINAKQHEGIRRSFGESGLNSFRNFMLQSDIKGTADKIALIASPDERKVVECTVIKGSPIPACTFFDFMDMFMDRNGYYPQSFFTTTLAQGYAELTLKPIREHFSSIGDNDDFLDNGLWFRWNLGGISVGNYYERLVCSNGQVARIQDKMAQVTSLNEHDMKQLMNIPSNNRVMQANWVNFSDNANKARNTIASMAELKKFKHILVSSGIESDECESVIPFNKYLEQYGSAGYNIKNFPLYMAKTNLSVWALFNILTHYATHTTTIGVQDNRRSYIMEESVNLLNLKRDIQEYINIF